LSCNARVDATVALPIVVAAHESWEDVQALQSKPDEGLAPEREVARRR
jgi:hypothetical protein